MLALPATCLVRWYILISLFFAELDGVSQVLVAMDNEILVLIIQHNIARIIWNETVWCTDLTIFIVVTTMKLE